MPSQKKKLVYKERNICALLFFPKASKTTRDTVREQGGKRLWTITVLPTKDKQKVYIARKVK